MKERTRSRRSRQTHQKLRTLRLNEGLSAAALGDRANVSGKTVRMAEAGYLPTPRVQYAIAEVFNLSPLDLWPWDLQEKERRARERDRTKVPA